MDFEAQYKNKLVSSEEAVKIVKSGDTVLHSMVVAEPPGLLNALVDRVRKDEINGVNIHTMIPLENSKNSYLNGDVISKLNAHSWFASINDRELIARGLVSFVPNLFHQVPLIMKEYMDVDVVFATVSPMDKNGYFTFGTSNDYITTAARNTKKLIIEVNPKMPRVFGDSLLHISEVDIITEFETELLTFLPHEPDSESKKIGKVLTENIPDGACIQLGVGSIPSAVCHYLSDHKNLGIHTEVLNPEMARLIETGAVNGSKKTLHKWKHTFSVAQGDKYLYDFINNNQSCESYPISLINDPSIIAFQENMISINSTLQVDLFGQCASEYINGRQYSASGGQLDFVRGAFNSKGGKSIIAFSSTAKNGTISRIVSKMEAGAVITVPRAEVHWICTEFGMYNFKGKSNKQRAEALISLAHPNFRDQLEREAKEMGVL